MLEFMEFDIIEYLLVPHISKYDCPFQYIKNLTSVHTNNLRGCSRTPLIDINANSQFAYKVVPFKTLTQVAAAYAIRLVKECNQSSSNTKIEISNLSNGSLCFKQSCREGEQQTARALNRNPCIFRNPLANPLTPQAKRRVRLSSKNTCRNGLWDVFFQKHSLGATSLYVRCARVEPRNRPAFASVTVLHLFLPQRNNHHRQNSSPKRAIYSQGVKSSLAKRFGQATPTGMGRVFLGCEDSPRASSLGKMRL